MENMYNYSLQGMDMDLEREKLRNQILFRMIENEGDPVELLKEFAEPIRSLFDCDQVIYCDRKESRVISNSPTALSVWAAPIEYCRQCPHFDLNGPVFEDGVAEVPDCREGIRGIPTHPECPVKSMLTRIVYCDDKPAGYLSVHYINYFHEFNDRERNTLAEFAGILSLSLSRYEAKRNNILLRKMDEQRQQDREAGLTSAIENLSDSYDYVVFVDNETNSAMRLKASPEFAALIDSFDPLLPASEKLDMFFNDIVFPADYQVFREKSELKHVRECFDRGETVRFECRLLANGKPEYYRIKINDVKGVNSGIVIGLYNINDDVLLREKLKNEEEKMEYLAVIDSFSRDFDCINYVRIMASKIDDISIPYRISEKLVRIIPDWSSEMNFSKRLDLLRDFFVTEDDRDFFFANTRREIIIDALNKHNVYYVNFRANGGTGTLYYQMKFSSVKDADGNLEAFVAGLHSVDDETRNEMKRSEEIAAMVSERTRTLRKANAALNSISDSVIELMGEIVESRNAESGQHIRRVKGFTNILAKQVQKDLPEYGLDDKTVNMITNASAMHDVGKIAIPDAILLKPGKLTEDEFEIMKTHSAQGAEIVSKMSEIWNTDYISMAKDICMFHHEKWDGKGYPKGLKGDKIPIAAQIVSIADIYDALTSKRCYKDAYTYEKSFEMILNGECGKFSDKLMKCFEKCRHEIEQYAVDPTEITTSQAISQDDESAYTMPEFIKSKEYISESIPLFSEIAENIPNGLFVYHKEGDGKIIFFNDLLAKMYGCESKEEFTEKIGTTFKDMVHPEDYDRVQREIDNQIASSDKALDHVIYRINRKDGVERMLDDYGHLVHSADLGDVFFVCVADVTDYSFVYEQSKKDKMFNGLHVLLVDDDSFTRAINKDLLESEGATVTEAENGEEALNIVKTSSFDLILMDVIMPVMNGTDAIKAIREDHKNTQVPIIALTSDISSKHPCLDAGADDFMAKPLNITKLSKKLIACMKRNSDYLDMRLKRAIQLADTDSLTGVKSATAFKFKVNRMEEAIKNGDDVRFAIVMCDINNLKYENDTYGHESGDLYIKNCCNIISSAFSHSPIYRIGGDEFAVILEDEDYTGRTELMRKLYFSVESSMKIEKTADGKASIAGGISEFNPESDSTVGDVMKRADESMYRNKAYMNN